MRLLFGFRGILRRRPRGILVPRKLRRLEKIRERPIRQQIIHILYQPSHGQFGGIILCRHTVYCRQNRNHIGLVMLQYLRQLRSDAQHRRILYFALVVGFLAQHFKHCFILRNIRDRLDYIRDHVNDAVALHVRQFHLRTLLLRFRFAGLDIHFKRHGVLRRHTVMRGVLKRKLAFRLIAGLNLETTSRQRIHEMHSDKAALGRSGLVGIVAHKPKICKVSIRQVISGRYLGGVGAVNVSRTDQGLRRCRVQRYQSAGRLNLPAFEPLQLFHVFGAVVDVVTEVSIRRGRGKVDATSSRTDLVIRLNCPGCRRETLEQNPSIDLNLLKSIGRNFRISRHFVLLSQSSVRYSSEMLMYLRFILVSVSSTTF
nr:MAG TPA: hypothetical protein [Caudoviricetes sp.]